MKVKDLIRTRRVVSLRPDDDLGVAAQMMGWANVRHLPVLSADGTVIGVLAERDLLRHRANAQVADAVTSVGDVMSTPAEVITPDDEVGSACATLVARKIGCLPVVDEAGHLIGIVTRSDLLVSQVTHDLAAPPNSWLKVEAAMRRGQGSVFPYSPLLEAVAIMVERGVRHVPVTDERGQLVGILSDRDVRTAIGDPLEALRQDLTELEDTKVSGVMTTDVIAVEEGTPLDEVARLFIDEKVGALPVTDTSGRLVGIVSYVDVISALQSPRTERTPWAEVSAPSPS